MLEILKYWKIALPLCILFVMGYGAFRYVNGIKQAQETELANLNREFKTLIGNMVQANNTAIKTQQELMDGLSNDYKKKLDEQNQKILAKIDGVVTTHINTISDQLQEFQPGVLTFPKQGQTHPIIDKLLVNTKKPETFEISFKPQEIHLNGTLNFSEKDKTMSFWLDPQAVTSNGGMEIAVKKLELQPSKELNAFITDLRGKKMHIPTMPKYTINLLSGAGVSSVGNIKNPYFGMQAVYNTTSGIGLGAMGVSNGQQFIVLGSLGFSFGKR